MFFSKSIFSCEKVKVLSIVFWISFNFSLVTFLRVFGPKAFPIKLLLPSLVSFFENADKNVREEAKALVVEIYKWLGQIVKTQIESLRPAQVFFYIIYYLLIFKLKELEAAFEELKGQKPPVPERYLRSQQAAALLGPPSGGTAGNSLW